MRFFATRKQGQGGQEATTTCQRSVEDDAGELVVGKVVLVQILANVGELGDEGAEDGGFLLGFEVVGAEGGGDEPALAGAVGMGFRVGFEGPGAGEDDEEVEVQKVAGDLECMLNGPEFGGEIGAGYEERSLEAKGWDTERTGFDFLRLIELQHVERFFNVQVALFSVGVRAIVVVDAVGEIGILLDFADGHAGADGVGSAGRDIEIVTGMNGVRLKKFFQMF